jgi:hypothetical protein
MRLVLNITVAATMLMPMVGHAEFLAPPPGLEQAKAALALAKAKRAREAKQTMEMSGKCYDNFAEAAEYAAKSGKPLVLWVGMKCEESPKVRESLPDVVHCHLHTYAGDASARIVFTDKDKHPHAISKENMSDVSGLVVRQLVGLPDLPKGK